MDDFERGYWAGVAAAKKAAERADQTGYVWWQGQSDWRHGRDDAIAAISAMRKPTKRIRENVPPATHQDRGDDGSPCPTADQQ